MSGPVFRSFADPGAPLGVEELIDAVVADPAPGPAVPDRRSPTAPDRPRTIGVMVASVDGHVTVEGRSGGLGGTEDRAVFRGLRARADALLVGSGTLNGERYATTLDEPHREARRSAGLPAEPLVATVTRGFSLDEDVPLLHEELMRVVVYTETAAPYPVDAERVSVVRLDAATPAAALQDLAARGARQVNCEGGPGLLAALAGDGLLDELLITVSPLLVGGDDALTMLRGDLGPRGPLPLSLRGAWRSGDVLFLHYHLTPGSPA